MNRRNFLKFAPALAAVPVVAIAAASNKVAPPSVASLPFTFEGHDGRKLVITEDQHGVHLNREDVPENLNAISLTKPQPLFKNHDWARQTYDGVPVATFHNAMPNKFRATTFAVSPPPNIYANDPTVMSLHRNG